MKNKLYFFFCLMLWTNATICQDSVIFKRVNGYLIGSGISTFHGQKATEFFEYKPIFFMGYHLGREYSKIGYSFAFEFENKGANKSVGNWKYNLSYLTIEPSVNIRIKPIAANVLAGYYGSLLLFKTVSSSNSILANYTVDGFKSTDFGCFIGFKIRVFTFTKNTIALKIQTNYGLLSIYENSRYFLSDWQSKWDRNLSLKVGLCLSQH